MDEMQQNLDRLAALSPDPIEAVRLDLRSLTLRLEDGVSAALLPLRALLAEMERSAGDRATIQPRS